MIELLLQAERALSVGLLDRAETLYRQVARADPRNSIAVVGLARVTLDRGDDEGALVLARRALAIDPENVAAQRMVTRLEEVIDYRVDAEAEIASVVLRPEGAVAEIEPVDAEAVTGQPLAVPAATSGSAAEPELADPGVSDEPEVTAEPEPERTAEAEPEPEVAAEPEVTSEAEVAGAEAEPEMTAEAEVRAEPEPEMTAETETEETAEPEVAVETTPEAEAPVELEPEVAAEAEAEVAAELEAEAVAEAEPEIAGELEPEAVAEAEPEIAGEPEAEPEIAGEPEAEPEIAVEPAPAPGPTASTAPAARTAAEVAPEPGPPHRRSFLDRLFRRH